MKEERLKKLYEFLENDPHDPFTIYAIASELVFEKPKEALKYFTRLLNEHPDYVATYYHAAHLFVELGNREKAEEVYKKGIAICQEKQELHALAELQSAYNNFLYDDEDE
ncbi:tetratricopeptide repeat protein [Flexithrix dorotheae]|uniref:tetratricopeptide repeat protein n=1 Tax=Flexithrix dorotheae TaxID=70993 RepID=UPI0003616611|nr:tetratricopeptide repeat protein [Flexithrix dorotheae]